MVVSLWPDSAILISLPVICVYDDRSNSSFKLCDRSVFSTVTCNSVCACTDIIHYSGFVCQVSCYDVNFNFNVYSFS